MVSHIGSIMSTEHSDIERLKGLLSEGHTLTKSAEILQVSRSTAQRMKKQLQSMSSSNDAYEIHWGVLGEYAVRLEVNSSRTKAMIDWSRPLYWNYESIFQQQNDYWLENHLGTDLTKQSLSQPMIQNLCENYLPQTLEIPRLSKTGEYKERFERLTQYHVASWIEACGGVYEAQLDELMSEGDLSQLEYIDESRESLIFEAICSEAEKHGWLANSIKLAAGIQFKKMNADVPFELVGLTADLSILTHFCEIWLELCKLSKEDAKAIPLASSFAENMVPYFDYRTLLTRLTSLSSEIIDYMIENDNFNSADVILAISGGIEGADLEFAKRGEFKRSVDIKRAKQLNCTSLEELNQVVGYGWSSGKELRNAKSRYDLEHDERELYSRMVEDNILVNWTGDWKVELLAWARDADEEDFKRLQGFPNPKALKFYEEVLLKTNESNARTDYLISDYNEIQSPGDLIDDEDDFSAMMQLSCFNGIAKVGARGVTDINKKSQSKILETWILKPIISLHDSPSLMRSRKKASKLLRDALENNELNNSLTGAYDWLSSNLKSTMELSSEEEFMLVDLLAESLGLTQKIQSQLHEARMARNWIGHPFEAKEVQPTWDMVKLCLKLAEEVAK